MVNQIPKDIVVAASPTAHATIDKHHASLCIHIIPIHREVVGQRVFCLLIEICEIEAFLWRIITIKLLAIKVARGHDAIIDDAIVVAHARIGADIFIQADINHIAGVLVVSSLCL